jgi:hypothetical protein
MNSTPRVWRLTPGDPSSGTIRSQRSGGRPHRWPRTLSRLARFPRRRPTWPDRSGRFVSNGEPLRAARPAGSEPPDARRPNDVREPVRRPELRGRARHFGEGRATLPPDRRRRRWDRGIWARGRSFGRVPSGSQSDTGRGRIGDRVPGLASNAEPLSDRHSRPARRTAPGRDRGPPPPRSQNPLRKPRRLRCPQDGPSRLEYGQVPPPGPCAVRAWI